MAATVICSVSGLSLGRNSPSPLARPPTVQRARRTQQSRSRTSLQVRMSMATATATATGEASSNVVGPMTPPSAFNKNWVRLLTATAVLIATARSTELWSLQAVRFVHLLSWGSFIGSNIWVTFIAGLTMFRNMPRQTFGKVQSKLFPQFFGLAVACLTLQLGTLLYGPGAAITQAQLIALGTALGGSLLNWLLIEPKATDLMFERYALENSKTGRDEEAIKKLYKKFGKWHGISSMVNLIVLCAGLSHGWGLARTLTFA